MQLKSASFKKYRLLKDCTIKFSVDTRKPLTVIRGENGFGKTTILDALRWAFYGTSDVSIALSLGMTLVFLAAPGDEDAQVELTYNWPAEDGSPAEVYEGGRNFGHLAYRVENIYETCQRLMDAGVTINRPPRDGHMAFVRSPDNISVELLQDGHLPPAEPWASMPNTGVW